MSIQLRIVLAVVVTAIAASTYVVPARAAAATAWTYTPVADAFVNQSAPSTNYGSSVKLYTDGSPLFSSYVRFQVAGLTGFRVTSATLRVFANTSGAPGEVYDVHGVSGTTWTEAGITYANAPALAATVGSSAAVAAGSWTSVDVTSLVKGDGAVDLALATSNTTRISFSSREGSNPPQLVIDAVPETQPSFPIRAAFYYPWYPEAWTQNGIYPFTRYTPSLGFYDSSATSVIQRHVAAMQYANIAVGIASWWGQGTATDRRLPTLLSTTTSLGSTFRWVVYYEPEGQGNPTVAQVTSDLAYLRDHYGSDQSYLRLGGRFVVFVFADPLDNCTMADRWKQADAAIGDAAYVVLKVFPGYRTCPSQPAGWHQYAPSVAEDSQQGFSFSISPGFFKANETTPRLARDLTGWNQNILDMVASGAPFQLVTTFNEWGEGTAVESAQEWASSSGYGAYLDALHANGSVAATPPSSTSPPTISGVPQQGQVLTSTNGSWSGTTPMTFTRQWRRCSASGASCVDVNGATAQTYTLVSTDVGFTMRVVVTASNSAGSAASTSTQTAVVTAAAAGPCGTSSSPPATYGHVIWVWMENHSYSQIIGSTAAPYINQLANACGLATNYHGVTHPSLPNYIAATSGDFWGITDDAAPSSHPLSVASIYSQVRAVGKTWRDYEESAPGNCPLSSSGTYAVKHDPAPYYVPIRSDCANWDVPLGTTSAGNFLTDLNNDTLPAFAFVTPNLCNDMHDCSVATGDAWLKSWLPKIFASAAYRSSSTVVFLVWDENDGSSGNQVAALVIGPTVVPGTRSGTNFSHYSLLRTTEQLLGLGGFLAHAGDAATASMRTDFHV